MSSYRVLSWSGAALVLLGVMAVSLLSLRQKEAERTAGLPDGSIPTLQAVRFGTNHCAPSPFWKRLLMRLPDKVRARFGVVSPTQYATTAPQLAFWLRWKDQKDSPPLSYWLADESGFESLAILSDISPSFLSLRTNLEQAVLGTEVFPRRSSTFRLRVYREENMLLYREADSKRSIRVADFKIQNPLRKSYPSWTAQRKPMAMRDGDMEFALTKLAIKINPREGPRPPIGFPNTWVEARFRITQAGRLCQDWKVESLELSEATGNAVRLLEAGRELSPQSLVISETIGEEEVSTFAWPFWLQETAWKMRVEFLRKPEARYRADELWTVKGIAAPAPKAVTMINQQTNLLGRPIRLMALVGEHAVLPGREHDVFGQTTIEVDASPLPPHLRFEILAVTDERGRVAEQVMRSGNESFGCQIPADARTVDIKLALYPRRCAEYLVRPTVQTNDVAVFKH